MVSLLVIDQGSVVVWLIGLVNLLAFAQYSEGDQLN
jgi:hypothetical protein